jgi:hypothetical protein
MFLDSGYGTIIDQSKMNHIGYNPSAVTGRKANGLYSTDKKCCKTSCLLVLLLD